MKTMKSDNELTLSKTEAAIKQLQSSNEKSIGGLRTDHEKAIGELRTDMEKNVNSITIRMIGIVALGVAILAFILK